MAFQLDEEDQPVDFGTYLAASMTPEQRDEWIARGQVDQEQPGGTPQAPTIDLNNKWTPQRVEQEKAAALSDYQQVWNEVRPTALASTAAPARLAPAALPALPSTSASPTRKSITALR